jgi:hypothetical protein
MHHKLSNLNQDHVAIATYLNIDPAKSDFEVKLDRHSPNISSPPTVVSVTPTLPPPASHPKEDTSATVLDLLCAKSNKRSNLSLKGIRLNLG